MRLLLLIGISALLVAQESPNIASNASNAPVYTADGKLVFPANYREWIYLTTGIDMDYNPDLAMMDHSMFDNVFVNQEAYKAFVATGTWPDKTILVLETRMAASKGSINKKGHYQTAEIMTRSIHIKDEARFPGKWAFFGFGGDNSAKQIPTSAPCYSCHQEHGAVDTTFVQFYPTLLEIAKKKGTLAAGYMKEEAANTKK
ncbi:MAG TPA: cytochrome P460 family protein [Candidatus Acidoferrales bacterium]|nr:cytochrome P460 family protein [Candidatus Acidoferrales bacterium]